MRKEPTHLRGISLDFAGIPPRRDENFPYEHAQVSQLGKVGYSFLYHSCKKRIDSLEGGLVRALFAAELEFAKTLVPRLPQNTSNRNIESTGKSAQP